jgi:sigma-B regulation protein RsbU (phosphoserine phosphatase)
VHLEQGDLLFMYTDGLTETKNSDDEDYGTERLEAFLRTHRELPADQILGRVHQAVQDFCGREDADDDITMIALKIIGKGISEEGEPT